MLLFIRINQRNCTLALFILCLKVLFARPLHSFCVIMFHRNSHQTEAAADKHTSHDPFDKFNPTGQMFSVSFPVFEAGTALWVGLTGLGPPTFQQAHPKLFLKKQKTFNIIIW